MTILLLSPIQTSGQNYGAKMGLTFSSLTGQGAFNIHPGLQLGVFSNLGSSEPFYVRTEFLLSQKGSFNWNSSNVNRIGLYYAEFPVMYCIEILEILTINLGISPALLITATRKTSKDGDSTSEFIGKDLERFDFSALVGLEYYWKQNISLGIRYNNSFVPLSGYGSDLDSGSTLPFSRTFQVYCNYKIK